MRSALNLSIISIVMPILAAVFLLAIAVLVIVFYYKLKRAQSPGVQSFEALAQELRADNEMIKSELEAIKGTLDSIHKMMKEIE